MHNNTVLETADIDRLMAEAETSMNQNNVTILAEQAEVIRKITNLSVEHKKKLASFFRHLSNDLAEKRQRSAASVPPAASRMEMRTRWQDRASSQTSRGAAKRSSNGGHSAVLPAAPVAIQDQQINPDEEGPDDSELIPEINAEELFGICEKELTSENQIFMDACTQIATVEKDDDIGMVDSITLLVAAGKTLEHPVGHLKLIILTVCIRREIHDPLRGRMLEYFMETAYKPDKDVRTDDNSYLEPSDTALLEVEERDKKRKRKKKN